MLPPGHIAAGYLTASIVLGALHYPLTAEQVAVLTFIGALIAFLPDLDFFAAFAKTHSFRIENDKIVHRKFPTHAPLLWLVIGLGVFFTASDPFYKAIGLLIWLCSWAHFILDSEWGIMWLWPFSTSFYPFSQKYYQEKYAKQEPAKSQTFFKYWFEVIRNHYSKTSGILEIIIIITAIIFAIVNK